MLIIYAQIGKSRQILNNTLCYFFSLTHLETEEGRWGDIPRPNREETAVETPHPRSRLRRSRSRLQQYCQSHRWTLQRATTAHESHYDEHSPLLAACTGYIQITSSSRRSSDFRISEQHHNVNASNVEFPFGTKGLKPCNEQRFRQQQSGVQGGQRLKSSRILSKIEETRREKCIRKRSLSASRKEINSHLHCILLDCGESVRYR